MREFKNRGEGNKNRRKKREESEIRFTNWNAEGI